MIDKARLRKALEEFSSKRILIIGDVMLDEFIWGEVERISPEAPVPVVNVKRETRILGGAANVVNNIVSIGASARICGLVGQDAIGGEIARQLEERGVPSAGLISDPARPSTVKTRVVAHGQQVVRFDREKRQDAAEDISRRALEYIAAEIEMADGVIISDYGKGMVTPYLLGGVRELASARGVIVSVDPKVGRFPLYQGFTVLTPNHIEAAAGMGVLVESEEDLTAVGHRIIGELACRAVLITRGERGMTLFEGQRQPRHIPTVARDVFDVTGAGDTVIAVLTLGLAAGLDFYGAAMLSNHAAGIVVGKVGTSTLTAAELRAALDGQWERAFSSERENGAIQ